MSRWIKQLKDHPIWNTIDKIGKNLDGEFDDTDSDAFIERRRLIRLVDMFRTTISELDAEVVQFSRLDELHNHLFHNVYNQTQAFAESGNMGHLVVANDQISVSLHELVLLRAIDVKSKSSKYIEKLSTVADQFAQGISKKQTMLETTLNEAKSAIAEQMEEQKTLKSTIDENKKQADGLIAEWQNQFNEAQNQRQVDFNNQQNQHRDETKKHTEAVVTAADETLTVAIANANQRIEAEWSGTENQLNEVLTFAEDKRQKILKLFEIVAIDSASAGYAKDASDEQKQADRWRVRSIRFIIANACWLFFLVIYTQFVMVGTIDWKIYPILFSLTGVLLYGAVYTAQQSARHRENERRNKWLALRVAAFEPFVSPLTQDQQNEMRKEIGAILFGESGTNESSDEDAPTTISAVADAVTKILKAVPK